ncbi:hypothetical protein B0H12DRAFT_1236369 [Mycena haematopus]|nr:hypothetical protein B0H12DRAFT_1236369 [Mycena haematopus]
MRIASPFAVQGFTAPAVLMPTPRTRTRTWYGWKGGGEVGAVSEMANQGLGKRDARMRTTSVAAHTALSPGSSSTRLLELVGGVPQDRAKLRHSMVVGRSAVPSGSGRSLRLDSYSVLRILARLPLVVSFHDSVSPAHISFLSSCRLFLPLSIPAGVARHAFTTSLNPPFAFPSLVVSHWSHPPGPSLSSGAQTPRIAPIDVHLPPAPHDRLPVECVAAADPEPVNRRDFLLDECPHQQN